MTRPRTYRDVVFYMPTATPLLVQAPRAPAGGAEQQVLMLARELARRGHAVGIVVFDDSGALRPRVEGVDVIGQPPPRTRLPLIRTVAFYARSLAVLRANPAEVLVQRAAGIHTALVAVAARLLGCRFVYASAGVHDFDLASWEPKRWIVRAFGLALRSADAVVVQTHEQMRLCLERFDREPLLIGSIAEPAPLPAGSPDAFVWAGTVIGHKRPLAFVELARAVPEARFVMVAVGEPSPAGADLAARLARAAKTVPNLDLLPPTPHAELGALLDRAVAVVSTSRSEGMPNVFLEGWSRGVPALALAHDPDGVIERDGLGACAGGAGERMAALARELWRTRADRAELAERCRRHVAREHALAPIADRWTEALGLGAPDRGR